MPTGRPDTPERAMLRAREALDERRPGWIALHAPPGFGKTSILSRLLQGRRAVVMRSAPLAEGDLLSDFRRAVREEFGQAPAPREPSVLPEPGGEPGWRELLLGLAGRTVARGRPLVLAFDDWEHLVAVRRRIPEELAEAFEVARRRGAALTAILVTRAAPDAGAVDRLGEPIASIRLGRLSFREAARAQGGTDARDSFLRWACLGSAPVQLPVSDAGSSWEEAVVNRVLRPGGDLHDAPIHRIERSFQRPGRYASLLRALAAGPLDWSGIVATASGIRSGGQMAPYLDRLEEEGLVVVERPLDAEPGARDRRYRLADPFWAFWMGCVLPHRSALLRNDPGHVWGTRIRPTLEGHLQPWLRAAAREWFLLHAAEVFGAESREVGGVWGDGPEFQSVAWLSNGRVCYVDARWSETPETAGRFDDLRHRMAETRHGIGREARAPVLVLPGGADEALRRRVARDPLARILDLTDLMGPPPEGRREE